MEYICFICGNKREIEHHIRNRRCSTCHQQIRICYVCVNRQWPPVGFRRTDNCCYLCVSKRRDAWSARVNAFVASELCAVLPPDLVRWYLLPAIYRSNPPPLTSYWFTGKISFPSVPYCFGCAARIPRDDFFRQTCSVCQLAFHLCSTCHDIVEGLLCFFCKPHAALL